MLTAPTAQRRTLAVAASGTLIALIAFTTPVASLADTAKGLHASTAAQAWILSSMSLGLAVALLASGAVADDLGRRRVFVIGRRCWPWPVCRAHWPSGRRNSSSAASSRASARPPSSPAAWP